MAHSLHENDVVKAERVTFSYLNAPSPILNSLDLTLKRSEILFLIGPGGMGKTTLLKILAGLYRPQAGEVFFNGAPLGKLSPRERGLVLRKVAMTFQKSGLFDSMTVFENLMFPLREVTNLNRDEAISLAQTTLESVELTEHGSKYPFEMSGGMQKRLGIARALVLLPEVVFYDDPTAGLDPITSKNIAELILEVHQKNGTATLISTSDLDLALGMSKRVPSKICFLYEGKIVETGSCDEILGSLHPVVYQFTRGLLEGPLSKGGP